MRLHPVGERMRRVDLDVENRARREVLIAREAGLEVLQRYAESLDRKIRRRAESDQRPSVRDEVAQRLDAVVADAAAILGTDLRAGGPFHDLTRVLVGQDDDVELVAQRLDAVVADAAAILGTDLRAGGP